MFDEKNREQMVSSKQIDALIALSESNMDLELGRRNYERFISARRRASVLRYGMRAACCAAVLAFFVAGTWLVASRYHGSGEVESCVAMIRTSAPIGHMASVDLPDGSHVLINANSYIEYPSSFSSTRHVNVCGEAFFDIAHDEEHPFVVSTGKLDIKVLGTKFNVYNYEGKMLCVALHEGSVLAYNPEKPEDSITLKPMQYLKQVEGGYEIRNLKENINTWVNGYYTFRNETLAEVRDRLETYYGCKIVISNPALTGLRFTGKFYQNDGVMEILRLMQGVHSFKIERDYNSNTVYIK